MNVEKDKVVAAVVTFNRLELLKQSINALRNQSKKPDAILVVNNSSTDGTGEWLERSGGQASGRANECFSRGFRQS